MNRIERIILSQINTQCHDRIYSLIRMKVETRIYAHMDDPPRSLIYWETWNQIQDQVTVQVREQLKDNLKYPYG